MAYKNHALVALVGGFNTPDMANEVWQCGIRVYTGDPSNDWLAGPQAYCDVIAPLIGTWFHGGAVFDSKAVLKTVKVNNINPAGHYAETVTHQTAVNVAGGAAGINPLFVSLATTLETGNTVGRARRGRIYLPTTATTGPGLGVQVTPADRDAVRDKVKALLAILLRNEPTGGLLVRPCIASKVDGTIHDINGVSVNSVLDVQRRRKNRAAATRSAIAAFP